jgi:hypothetical protein
MNKKGQALVSFILLIPVFLLVFAFIVDGGNAYYKKNEIISIVKSSLKNNKDIETALINNKIKYNNLKIDIKNDEKCVILDTVVDTTFSSIIGIKEYKIQINECKRIK